MILASVAVLSMLAIHADERLPGTTRPVRYQVKLDVDPGRPEFRGEETITVQLTAAARELLLHAVGLTIESAELRPVNGKPVKLLSAQRAEVLVLTGPGPLPMGTHSLSIKWKGSLDAHKLKGLYRFQSGGAWYVGSQFEATDARRLAPCFDEPGFKVPWQLTLDIPADTMAISNGAVARELPRKAGRRIEFAETRPLPTYLWAVLVGPFDVVEAGKVGNTPLRVVVPRGKGAQAAYAGRTVVKVVEYLEKYFGIPFPYGKLDNVALAEFGAGGMENAGAITYREEGLLLDEAHAPVAARRRVLGLVAHEVAHQWFGDLVTMEWWDDLWLNEAFASWMGSKVAEALAPELEKPADNVGSQTYAMFLDSLPSTHPIQVPVDSAERADEVFDAITYAKGMGVLAMLEAWLGEQVFQQGLRRYLQEFSDRNARAADLFAALAEAAGKPDVIRVADAWLTQPHHPLITATITCSPRPSLKLEQQWYASVGAAPTLPVRPTPVCVTYPDGAATKQVCTLVEQPVVVPLESKACPAWVLPNTRALGFYRYRVAPEVMGALVIAAPGLREEERAQLLDNAWTLVRQGLMPLAEFARIMDGLAQDKSRQVVGRVADRWRMLRDTVADDADVPAVSRHIGTLLGPRATALGWDDRPGDDEETRELRARMVSTMLRGAEDPAWLKEADARTWKWLEDPRAISPDVARAAVTASALNFSLPQVQKFQAALGDTQDPERRVLLVSSLAASREPKVLNEALAFYSDPRLRTQDLFTFMGPAFSDRATRATAWTWFKANWTTVTARLEPDWRTYLPQLMSGACTKAERDDVASYFADPAHPLPGTGARLKETLDTVDACVDLRQKLSPQLKDLVASWNKPAVKAPAKTGKGRK